MLKMKWVGNKKSRIVVVKTKPNNGLKLNEVLCDDEAMNLIKDTQAVMEIRAFNEFFDKLSSNSERACYGPKSVEAAHELLTIETLLIYMYIHTRTHIHIHIYIHTYIIILSLYNSIC